MILSKGKKYLRKIISVLVIILVLYIGDKYLKYREFKQTVRPIEEDSVVGNIINSNAHAYTIKYSEDKNITSEDIRQFIVKDTSEDQSGNLAYAFCASYKFYSSAKIKTLRSDSLDFILIYYEINPAFTIADDILETEITFFDFFKAKENILLFKADIWRNISIRTKMDERLEDDNH